MLSTDLKLVLTGLVKPNASATIQGLASLQECERVFCVKGNRLVYILRTFIVGLV